MFIAMNRFRIAPGREEEFTEIWKKRDTYIETVPGFREFHLLEGISDAEQTLFVSHSVWDSKDAFETWTHSEAFRKAHAGGGAAKGIYLGHPTFEGFEVVI